LGIIHALLALLAQHAQCGYELVVSVVSALLDASSTALVTSRNMQGMSGVRVVCLLQHLAAIIMVCCSVRLSHPHAMFGLQLLIGLTMSTESVWATYRTVSSMDRSVVSMTCACLVSARTCCTHQQLLILHIAYNAWSVCVCCSKRSCN